VFTQERGSRKMELPGELSAYLARYSPSFLVNGKNEAKERGNRTFEAVPVEAREIVEALFENVCNTWEITTIPFPNQTVKPQQSWQARVPMLVLAEKQRHVQFLHLNCTYEGSRQNAGRTEAVIRLEGGVRGRGARSEMVLGTVTGSGVI